MLTEEEAAKGMEMISRKDRSHIGYFTLALVVGVVIVVVVVVWNEG